MRTVPSCPCTCSSENPRTCAHVNQAADKPLGRRNRLPYLGCKSVIGAYGSLSACSFAFFLLAAFAYSQPPPGRTPLRERAAAGDAEAQFALGKNYEGGRSGLKKITAKLPVGIGNQRIKGMSTRRRAWGFCITREKDCRTTTCRQRCGSPFPRTTRRLTIGIRLSRCGTR